MLHTLISYGDNNNDNTITLLRNEHITSKHWLTSLTMHAAVVHSMQLQAVFFLCVFLSSACIPTHIIAPDCVLFAQCKQIVFCSYTMLFTSSS